MQRFPSTRLRPFARWRSESGERAARSHQAIITSASPEFWAQAAVVAPPAYCPCPFGAFIGTHGLCFDGISNEFRRIKTGAGTAARARRLRLHRTDADSGANH